MNFGKLISPLLAIGFLCVLGCGDPSLDLSLLESYATQTGQVLQHVQTGKFVRVRSDSFLVADSSRVTNAELFLVGAGKSGSPSAVSFTSVSNGKVVRAGVGQESWLGAFSPHVLGWETFRFQTTTDNAFFLISDLSNKPVTVDGNRGGLLMANASSTRDSFKVLSSDEAMMESLTQLCVNEINAYRKQKGKQTLGRAKNREECARGQAKDDSIENRAHAHAYRCGESAQNECLNYSNDDSYKQVKFCLKQMFDEGASGGHYINMMDSMYHSVACGIYMANNKITLVHDFYR